MPVPYPVFSVSSSTLFYIMSTGMLNNCTAPVVFVLVKSSQRSNQSKPVVIGSPDWSLVLREALGMRQACCLSHKKGQQKEEERRLRNLCFWFHNDPLRSLPLVRALAHSKVHKRTHTCRHTHLLRKAEGNVFLQEENLLQYRITTIKGSSRLVWLLFFTRHEGK